jgi:outer membrane protein assembly factor BamB
LFVATNGDGLFALDYRTGRVRWRFKADNDVMSAPLIDRGIVIISSGDQEPRVWDPPHYVVAGTGPSTVYGIDERTGRERWHLRLPGTGMPTGVIFGDEFVHLDGSGTLLALDVQTGRVRWRTNVGSSAFMSEGVNLDDGTMLFSGGFPNAVYRVRASDGHVIWRRRFADCEAGFTDQPLAADDRRVYGAYLKLQTNDPRCFGVAAAGVENAYALDLRSGELLWERVLSRGAVPSRNEGAIPLVHDGVLYIGSNVAAQMHALDAATGRVLWRRNVSGAVKGGSVAIDGTLFFGDLSGRIWALDAARGTVRGVREERAHFNVGSPIVVNRTLIIGAADGTVLAIPLESVR